MTKSKDNQKPENNQSPYQRESMVFYRSFWEAIRTLPPEDQAQLYDAIFSYSLDFKEPELPKKLEGFFTLIKPQLEANLKRYHNGKKGADFGTKGAEHGKKGGRPKNNETGQKPPGNPPNVNVNANANENGNVNGKKGGEPHKNKFSEAVSNLYESLLPLFDLQLQPKTKKQVHDWKETLRKLIEIDQKDPEEIKNVVKWTRQNDFWSKNFLSLNKLRQKDKQGVHYFEVFKAQYQNSGENSTNKPQLKERAYMALSVEERAKYDHPILLWGNYLGEVKVCNQPGEAPKLYKQGNSKTS